MTKTIDILFAVIIIIALSLIGLFIYYLIQQEQQNYELCLSKPLTYGVQQISPPDANYTCTCSTRDKPNMPTVRATTEYTMIEYPAQELPGLILPDLQKG